jgi:hypothetical protein
MYMEEKDRGDSDEAQTINMGYEAAAAGNTAQ